MKILIVDDEPDICEILQYNLETEGFEVCCVNSAEEALEMRLKDFSLILLDVMPDGAHTEGQPGNGAYPGDIHHGAGR